jgi:hypothetical protein
MGFQRGMLQLGVLYFYGWGVQPSSIVGYHNSVFYVLSGTACRDVWGVEKVHFWVYFLEPLKLPADIL